MLYEVITNNITKAEITHVIINTIKVTFRTLLSFFILLILLILLTIVKNTSGTTTVNIIFKNMSPNGFKYVAESGKKIPTILVITSYSIHYTKLYEGIFFI